MGWLKPFGEMVSNTYQSTPLDYCLNDESLKTQALEICQGISQFEMNSEVLMQSFNKIMNCETLKEEIIKLLKTPDGKMASFFRKIPYNLLKGVYDMNNEEIPEVKEYASFDERVTGIPTTNSAIDSPFWSFAFF